MSEKVNANAKKKQMPEHIRKMFEQKNAGKQPAGIIAEESLNKQEDVLIEDNPSSAQESIEQYNLEEQQTNELTQELTEEVQNSEQEDVQNLEQTEDVEEQTENSEEKTENIEEQEVNTEEQAEQKQEKKSKNKKEKNKKKSKKAKIIIICLLVGVILIGLGVGAYIIFRPTYTKMQAPVVTIHSLSNQTILYVPENKEATNYEFFIQKNGQINTTYLKIKENSISIKDYFSTPGTYIVWARYVGENNTHTSDYSKKVSYQYLESIQTPVVSMSQDKTKLTWPKISQAKEYKLYYSTNGTQVQTITIMQPETLITSVEFKMSEINKLQAGKYTIYVQAIASNDGYYKDSELTQRIEYDNIKVLSDVLNATYSSNNKTVTFNIDTEKTQTNKFEISINNGTIVYGFSSDNLAEIYTVDLAYYVKDITVTNLKIKAIGDGEYIINSNYKDVTIS